MKTIQASGGLTSFGHQIPYECQFDWGEIFVQAGADGIVFITDEPGKDYRTAFFESFPREPATFIRGEGKTIQEAESNCWEQWQRFQACPGHEFERRGYTNGAGFCKHCGMFKSQAFEPSTLCCICNTPTNHTYDKNDKWYCETHQYLKMPQDFTDIDWYIVESEHSRYQIQKKWEDRIGGIE